MHASHRWGAPPEGSNSGGPNHAARERRTCAPDSGQQRQATDLTRTKPGILLASSWDVTIQIGDGPPQEASLRLLADASSWVIDIGTGTTLFPHRTRKLHLRVLDASALEEALLRFLDIDVPPLWERRMIPSPALTRSA